MLIDRIKHTASSTTNDVMEICLARKNGFVNPYSYYVSRALPVDKVPDNIFLDGIALVILSKIFGIKVRRYSFDMTSMAPLVFSYAIECKQSLAFIGGSDLELDRFTAKLKKEYPNISVAAVANGFDYDVKGYATVLSRSKPDIVIIGMGAPLQDRVMAELHELYPATYFTCGGFITQSASGLTYYPALVDKLNLRFVYRAAKENHYRKRLFLYPKACIVFIYDLLKSV